MINNLNAKHLALSTISVWKQTVEVQLGIEKTHDWYLRS